MNTTTIRSFIKSRGFVAIIIAVGSLAVIASTFSAGMAIGYRKARSSYVWGENYHRTFAGPRDGFMRGITRDFGGRDFIEPNGVFGTVIKTGAQSIIISGRDGSEREVAVASDTVIRLFRDDVPFTALTVGEQIVVLGSPSGDTGALVAKLIRIIPPPPAPSVMFQNQ